MYGNEPPASDTLSTYVFHLMSSAFACSSHQSVYFTLSLNFWAIHFGHYLFFSLILIGEKLMVKREFRGFKMLPWYEVSLLALSQFFVSSTTCLIHDNGSNGALYAQRVSDFAVTLVVIFVGKNFVDPKIGVPPRFRLLLIVIGVATSLSWCEKFMTFSIWYLLLWPILAFSTAVHNLLIVHYYSKHCDYMSVQDFMINVALWTTLFLLPGAIGFPNDSVTKEWYNIASAWEISDYGIFCMAFVSISIMMYTKYWLLCKCTQETYLAMWHFKYLMASYSQLFFQLMAHINVLSGVSRLTAAAAMVIYYRKRSQLNKANESHHHQNQNGQVVKNPIHQNGTVSHHV